jgi:phosphoglycerate dehydrogenase-like enzyme
LGLLGLGKIGLQVAKVGQAFGMNVVAWSQNLTKETAEASGIALAPSKEALLETSDFVSVHLVLSERTKDLIRAADIARMRPSAYLINTSRGPIVNEADLIQALQEQRIAGAGLDVFEVEPLPAEHPFRTLPNVLATPHLGYVTKENYDIYFKEALENIQAYIHGSCIRMLSNP